MKLMKKAILAVVTFVLALVAFVAPVKLTNVEAATITGGTLLYLTPNSNWKQSSARFAAYFFGSGDAWASMTKVEGETDLYQVVTPEGNWTNVIFCRMNPSASANNWNNKWNQTSDLVYDGTKNHYTVKSGTWDKGGGTWSVYTPKVEIKEFNVTSYKKDGTILSSKTVKEGTTFNPEFVEEEGFRLEGWYKDSALSTKMEKGSLIESDLTLYPNYVEAEDYTLYVKTTSDLGSSVNAYMWREATDGGNNSWPGVALTKVEDNLYSIEMDASKSFDRIIFNGNSKQTGDLIIPFDGRNLYTMTSLTAGEWSTYTPWELEVKVGYQVGTKDEAKALRLVASLNLDAERLETFESTVQFRVTKGTKADTREVTRLYSSVNPMNGEAELTGAYYAVLTYVNIPAGEYTVEVLVDGEVAATVVATVA